MFLLPTTHRSLRACVGPGFGVTITNLPPPFSVSSKTPSSVPTPTLARFTIGHRPGDHQPKITLTPARPSLIFWVDQHRLHPSLKSLERENRSTDPCVVPTPTTHPTGRPPGKSGDRVNQGPLGRETWTEEPQLKGESGPVLNRRRRPPYSSKPTGRRRRKWTGPKS